MKKVSIKKIIDEYFNKYRQDDNTIAIILTGSLGRHQNDEFSDVDWVLVVKNKDALLSTGYKEMFKNIIFDCRIEKFSDLKEKQWCMNQYYAYLNCSIYYEKGLIFSELIKLQRKNWIEFNKRTLAIKLVECSVFLKFPDEYMDLAVDITHFEKFIKRKDFNSAYNCLRIIVEQLIDLCYLSNKMQIPDTKNKLRYIENLEFFNELKSIIDVLNYNIKSLKELSLKYEIYKQILNKILSSVEKNFSFDMPLKDYYYKYRGKMF